MTKISRDDVRHLASLSSLGLKDSEIDSQRLDLERILQFVKQLDELDTEGIEPTYQIGNLSNVFRSDEVEVSNVSRETLLALAPEQAKHQIKVAKVL